MKIACFAGPAIVALCMLAQPAWADPDTGNFQINAAHDGHVRFNKDFHAPLRRKWVRDLGKPVSRPIYGGGLVFVLSGDDFTSTLYALSGKDGQIVWSTNVDLESRDNPPAYDNGRIFFVQRNGILRAYDAQTGNPEWSSQENDEFFFYAPTAKDGAVYFTADGTGSSLYGVKEKRGKLNWRATAAGYNSFPAVGGGNVYTLNLCDGNAYDVVTGERLWEYSGDCPVGHTPVYFNGSVYLTANGAGSVVDAMTGAQIRSFPAAEFVPAFWTSADGSNSLGIVVDINGAMSAFKPNTGKTVWSVPARSFWTPPVVVNDTLLIADYDGTLYAFDPASGAQTWSTSLGVSLGDSLPVAMSAGGNMLLVPMVNQVSAWTQKGK